MLEAHERQRLGTSCVNHLGWNLLFNLAHKLCMVEQQWQEGGCDVAPKDTDKAPNHDTQTPGKPEEVAGSSAPMGQMQDPLSDQDPLHVSNQDPGAGGNAGDGEESREEGVAHLTARLGQVLAQMSKEAEGVPLLQLCAEVGQGKL